MEAKLEALRIKEEEEQELEITSLGPAVPQEDFSLCLVGTFVTDKTFNFLAMKNRMAEIWRPGRGVSVQDLGEKLILFRFYHEIDLRYVMDNGPWTHNSNLLVLHELKRGEQSREVLLMYADFWVQIYDLPYGFFAKAVDEALGGFIGSFVTYDETTYGDGSDRYIRVRVLMDVRKPLKREKKIKRPGEQPVTCRL